MPIRISRAAMWNKENCIDPSQHSPHINLCVHQNICPLGNASRFGDGEV